MAAVSKNVYFNVLDDIVNEYNNTYHRPIKMKPKDLDSNEKDSKFKISDHVTVSNYKNIFAKGYAPDWAEYR